MIETTDEEEAATVTVTETEIETETAEKDVARVRRIIAPPVEIMEK
jgi:hypothetical protein